MDAVSALSSINVNSPIAIIGTPASLTRTTGVPDSTATSPSITPPAVLPTPSALTTISELARTLQAQQAANPSLDINSALARNLLNPALTAVTGGPLYTSAGLLRQFAGAQLATQFDTTQAGSAATPDSQALTSIADASLQAAETATQTLQDDLDAAASDQSSVNGQADNAANSATNTDTGSVSGAAVFANASQQPVAVTVTDTSQTVATDTTAAAITAANTTTTQTAPAIDTGNVASVAADALGTIDTQSLAENLDPYQQAALIGGLTTFGKELSTFVQAASESVTQAAVNGASAIAAVAALRSRNERAADTSG